MKNFDTQEDNRRKQNKEAIALARAQGVRLYRNHFTTNPIPDYEDGDFIITSDPVYKLALTELSVVWDGTRDVPAIYRGNKDFVFDYRYQVAALLSPETKTLANGVTRRKVLAANFVFYNENGERVYLTCGEVETPDPYAYSNLHEKLKALGFVIRHKI